MTITAMIRALLAAAAAGLTPACSALAAGEPKNGLPFTRPVGAQTSATLTGSVRHTAQALAQVGEAKNELPLSGR
jgi:hypothetical protein